MGRNVKIVETVAGSVMSTKQFVWCGGNTPCEARDGSSAITAQYFSRGQTIGGTTNKYCYTLDHLGSVRELTDSSGVIQAQYSYDPYGQVTKLQGSLASDFQYAGYFFHAPSGLNLTLNRAYSSALGRFINRDPIEEDGGVNLYDYVNNDPIGASDPSGMAGPVYCNTFCSSLSRWAYGWCMANSNTELNCRAIAVLVYVKCMIGCLKPGSSKPNPGAIIPPLPPDPKPPDPPAPPMPEPKPGPTNPDGKSGTKCYPKNYPPKWPNTSGKAA